MLKTYRHEFVVQGNYGSGWEDVHTELTRGEGMRRLMEYRKNCPPQYLHRMVVRKAAYSEVV